MFSVFLVRLLRLRGGVGRYPRLGYGVPNPDLAAAVMTLVFLRLRELRVTACGLAMVLLRSRGALLVSALPLRLRGEIGGVVVAGPRLGLVTAMTGRILRSRLGPVATVMPSYVVVLGGVA